MIRKWRVGISVNDMPWLQVFNSLSPIVFSSIQAAQFDPILMDQTNFPLVPLTSPTCLLPSVHSGSIVDILVEGVLLLTSLSQEPPAL